MTATTSIGRQRVGGHAVVLGASMAGLLAARVAADAFDRVTVVERDHLPPVGTHRRGVPQSRHAHGLLARGREVLEELFPGLTDELVARGASTGDILADTRWYHEGVRLKQVPSGLKGLTLSRPLLEGHVRERLAALPNVTIADGHQVASLVTTADASRVTGVRLVPSDDGRAGVLDADLVVDATGRGSRSPAWLAELGYEPPQRDEVRPRIAYASAVFRRRPDHLDGDLAAIVTATERARRGGALLAMEDDRWLVTLIGYLGERPPTDPEAYVAWAKTLPAPDIHEVIADAEPLEAPLPTRFPASVRLRYERLDRFPEGLVVTGDALCSFNPALGQGMTVAALEALALRRSLRAGTDRLGRRFFRAAARLIDTPWSIAVGVDLRFPEVEGPRTPKVRMVNAYLARLQVAAGSDPVLARAFVRVTNLIDPPEHLLRPDLALRVTRAALAAG